MDNWSWSKIKIVLNGSNRYVNMYIVQSKFDFMISHWYNWARKAYIRARDKVHSLLGLLLRHWQKEVIHQLVTVGVDYFFFAFISLRIFAMIFRIVTENVAPAIKIAISSIYSHLLACKVRVFPTYYVLCLPTIIR